MSNPKKRGAELLDFHKQMVVKIGQKKYDEAREFAQKILEIDPKGSNGIVHYNLACVEAQTGNTQKSLLYLKHALMRDYTNYATIYKDADLVQVRKDAQFPGETIDVRFVLLKPTKN